MTSDEDSRDYYILFGDNDEEHTAHVVLADEGIVIDMFTKAGEHVATWARTIDEFIDTIDLHRPVDDRDAELHTRDADNETIADYCQHCRGYIVLGDDGTWRWAGTEYCPSTMGGQHLPFGNFHRITKEHT